MIQQYFTDMQSVISNLNIDQWDKSVNLIKEKYTQGKQIFTCGNGGSATTASHYLTDWNKMTLHYNKRGLRGICLNDNIGTLTAYANDYSYEDVFAEQLKFYAEQNDLLIIISGSGNSENVNKALISAKELGVQTMAVVGFDGGKALSAADYCVHVPIADMQISEDLHLIFGHIVMKTLCNGLI
jgi:D-sedoheptulose 7-phosphate isomerase